MQITVNGESHHITESSSVMSFLEGKGLIGKRMAVELNGDILPRSEYANTLLQDGDNLEIVIAVGGG
jgi:sulfur carrier protein